MKKLYLGSKDNRKMLGVCAGIAETYDIDPTVVRIVIVTFGFILLIPFSLSYIAAWALIPSKTED